MHPVDVGFIECKDVPIQLDPIETDSDLSEPSTENGRQLKRYRATYENLLLTNYREFRWFRNGTRRGFDWSVTRMGPRQRS